jgi:Pectate lyase superfamily protein
VLARKNLFHDQGFQQSCSISTPRTKTCPSGPRLFIRRSMYAQLLLFILIAALSTLSTPSHASTLGAQLTTKAIVFPTGFMPSVKSFGAYGDGVHDDTAAIQAALSQGRSSATADYFGSPKGLYFPAGTYLVHDTLRWNGCCVTLQGTGPSTTTIRLAPGSAGFNNPASPKPLIITPSGQESFHQEIWDLKLEIGANNPGATALSYSSNNMGSVSDVLITTDDGKGYAGIDMTRQWPGPLMIRNTEVDGFSTGITVSMAEYGSTFENITLKNQSVVGINNLHQPIEIHNLSSTNKVPVLNNNAGLVVLLDATLSGGSSANDAIVTNAPIYLRNVTESGYGATLKDSTGKEPVVTTGSITEHLVGTPRTLTGNLESGSLKLDVVATPTYTGSNTDSAPVIAKSFCDMTGLLPAFASGKSMVYFPFGTYCSYNEIEVTVPDNVKRISGFSSAIFGNADGYNGGSIRLVVSSNSTTPLVIDQITGVKVDHRGARPVVIKDSEITYTTEPGAGPLYIDDVTISNELVVQPYQQVWARQLNDEVTGQKIQNSGGSLWILGLKTEKSGMVINTTKGGLTELLGALIYPAQTVPSTDVAFRSQDSQASYIYAESDYASTNGYATQVQEIRNGVTKAIKSSQAAPYLMPLFIGFEQ